MKTFVKSVFRSMGVELRRLAPPSPVCNYSRNEEMFQGLVRYKAKGIPVNTLIDVGAAAGTWSLSASEIWPDSNFILFEPLAERKAELQALCESRGNFNYIGAAAGKEDGVVSFHVSDDLDGSGVAGGKGEQNLRTVQITSISKQVKAFGALPPYVIKLDTHGFEVPIIEGCQDILQQVSLFIIECYGFHITKDSLLFWEMCRFMEERGFRLIDIVDILRRPKDKAFWQCDAFFAPAGLDIFTDNSYQ